MIGAVANHLWQSTILGFVIALFVLAFRQNRAQVRYWLWFTASAKFLVPFTLLISLGTHLHYASTTPPLAMVRLVRASSTALTLSEPFIQSTPMQSPKPSTAMSRRDAILGIWLAGLIVVILSRVRAWLQIRKVLRASSALEIAGVHLPPHTRLRVAPGLWEPGVVGYFRPTVLLPQGIMERLTSDQLQSVLAHEFCHIRQRDNLKSAFHMVVEAVFWFHPLVWYIGARLVDEREQACDEDVLRAGNHPGDYAEAILTVCKSYRESPLHSVAGVTGADLKNRIQKIIAGCSARDLSTANKLLLTLTAIVWVSPMVAGSLAAPLMRAQQQERPRFDAVSIKPTPPGVRGGGGSVLPGGKMVGRNQSLKRLMSVAYSVSDYQIFGDPKVLDEPTYDTQASAGFPADTPQLRLMLQTALEDQFKLKYHHETRELLIYMMSVAKPGVTGPGLVPNSNGDCAAAVSPQSPSDANKVAGALGPCGNVNFFPTGSIKGYRGRLVQLADRLSMALGRPVVDHTELTGLFDIVVTWTPDPTSGVPLAPNVDPMGPSLFTAIQEQLGLKLTAGKGPVDVIVVDYAEKLQ